MSGTQTTGALNAATQYTLTCTGTGGTTQAQVSVTVAANAAPVAHAGADQTVFQGATVTLTGAASSDSDGTVASHAWTQIAGPTVTLDGSTLVTPSFIAPVVAVNTTLSFRLFVLDNQGASSAADEVNVVVRTATGTVTLSGVVTYARVPHVTIPGGRGLDYAATRQENARGVPLDLINTLTQAVIASTTTGNSGDYFLAGIPAGTAVSLRVRAELLRLAPQPLPHWQVLVRDAAGQTYSYTGNNFSSSVASQNLAIPSGWDTATRKATGTRHAAPFAILDTIWRSIQFVRAVAPLADFPQLAVDWNTTATGSSYLDAGGAATRHIIIAGAADVDVDEYDPHTIAHEFGHYIEDRFSRSDSVGGPHGYGDILDPRVAFGEGFGYAFAAMVLADPVVRDAGGVDQLQSSLFNINSDEILNEGWYSEATVWELLWDLYDSDGESGDSVVLPFSSFWTALTGAQRNTDAQTSVFSFAAAMRASNPASSASIDQLVSAENISAPIANQFGAGETHFPVVTGVAQSDILPLYTPTTVGGAPLTLRSVGEMGSIGTYNGLSNRRFLRLDVPGAQTVRIIATSVTSGRDVDVVVWRRGLRVPPVEIDGGTTAADENFTLALPAADTYIIEALDCGNSECGPSTPGAADFTVAVTTP